MKYLMLFLIFCSSLPLLSCSSVRQETSVAFSVDDEVPFPLPATFTGNIPCPDCLRVEITLNLRPDSIYQLRKTYQAEHEPLKIESQLGRWRFAEEGNFIILGKEKGALKSYEIKDNNRLKFVGLESVGVASQIDYNLLRKPEVDPFTDSVKLRGMLSYESGRAVIQECTSGQSFPVTGAAEYRQLVQTYLDTPHSYAEPLLVSIRGKLVKETNGAEQIIVELFKRFYPDRDCEGNPTKTNLTGTTWRLIEVNGQQVTPNEKIQQPYFILDPKEKKWKGVGICNSIYGTYLVKGEVFLIKRLISSRMACPEGMDVETSFIRALESTETYQINGDLLQLRDQEGKTKAVLIMN